MRPKHWAQCSLLPEAKSLTNVTFQVRPDTLLGHGPAAQRTDEASADQAFSRHTREEQPLCLPQVYYHILLKPWNSEVDWTQTPTEEGSITHHSNF